MPAVGAASRPVCKATAQRCPASGGASAGCKHAAAYQHAGRHPWAACTALPPRRQRRAAAAAAAAATADEQAAGIRIVPSTLREDLQAAAWLRAEAYYEDRSVGRFKQSFIKQFAQQHFYSLLRQAGECVTLVASEGGPEDSDAAAADDTHLPQQPAAAAAAAQRAAAAALAAGGPQGPGSCLGTLDVRLLAPEAAGYGSRWPDGIPLDGPAPAGYVSNVVVAASQRGRGLGRRLVAAGVALAQRSWGVRCLYCHVETDNEAALRLYRGSGFAQHGEELPPAEEGQGRRLLLCLAVEPGQ